ncbi:MAG: hypothetical protein HY461_02695 [Parcubacteria group bacterium]|nr:hypothetical protein [Parcubacteria group bacterium]
MMGRKEAPAAPKEDERGAEERRLLRNVQNWFDTEAGMPDSGGEANTARRDFILDELKPELAEALRDGGGDPDDLAARVAPAMAVLGDRMATWPAWFSKPSSHDSEQRQEDHRIYKQVMEAKRLFSSIAERLYPDVQPAQNIPEELEQIIEAIAQLAASEGATLDKVAEAVGDLSTAPETAAADLMKKVDAASVSLADEMEKTVFASAHGEDLERMTAAQRQVLAQGNKILYRLQLLRDELFQAVQQEKKTAARHEQAAARVAQVEAAQTHVESAFQGTKPTAGEVEPIQVESWRRLERNEEEMLEGVMKNGYAIINVSVHGNGIKSVKSPNHPPSRQLDERSSVYNPGRERIMRDFHLGTLRAVSNQARQDIFFQGKEVTEAVTIAPCTEMRVVQEAKAAGWVRKAKERITEEVPRFVGELRPDDPKASEPLYNFTYVLVPFTAWRGSRGHHTDYSVTLPESEARAFFPMVQKNPRLARVLFERLAKRDADASVGEGKYKVPDYDGWDRETDKGGIVQGTKMYLLPPDQPEGYHPEFERTIKG